MEALKCFQRREGSCEGSEHSTVGAAEGTGWVSVEKRSSGESSWLGSPWQEVVGKGGQPLLPDNSSRVRAMASRSQYPT